MHRRCNCTIMAEGSIVKLNAKAFIEQVTSKMRNTHHCSFNSFHQIGIDHYLCNLVSPFVFKTALSVCFLVGNNSSIQSSHQYLPMIRYVSQGTENCNIFFKNGLYFFYKTAAGVTQFKVLASKLNVIFNQCLHIGFKLHTPIY